MSIGFRGWATNKLRNGDLTALSAIANGMKHTEEDRIQRLVRRGFVVQERNGRPSITVRGRVALTIWHLALR